MAIIDNIKDRLTSIIPQRRETLPVPGSTGVGHNVYRGEDVMSISTHLGTYVDKIHLVDPH